MIDTISNTITTTMDGAGRLVIPKPLRDAAGLGPGLPLHLTFRDGRIEIEAAPRDVRIVDRNGFRVAEPTGPYETLRDGDIRTVRKALRKRRP